MPDELDDLFNGLSGGPGEDTGGNQGTEDKASEYQAALDSDTDGAEPEDTVETQQPPAGGDQAPPKRDPTPQEALIQLRQYQSTLIPAFQREIAQHRQELERLNGVVQGHGEFTTALQQFGLTPQEAKVGLQMVAAYKHNPVQLLGHLVQRAKAENWDISSIQGTTTPQPQDVVNQVVERLKTEFAPLFQHNQTQVATERLHSESQSMVNDFLAQHNDAIQHQPLIGLFISRGFTDNLETAYWMAKNWCHEQGLDWSAPIKEQLAARGIGNGSTSTVPGPGVGTRRSNAAVGQANGADDDQFDVNTDNRTAIRSIARQYGLLPQ